MLLAHDLEFYFTKKIKGIKKNTQLPVSHIVPISMYSLLLFLSTYTEEAAMLLPKPFFALV